MPQVDFGRVFNPAAPPPTHDSIAPPQPSSVFTADDGDAYPTFDSEPNFSLSRSQWTNIAFVSSATMVALICALYFFGGTDLLRSAAAWPRELIYPHPPHLPKPVLRDAAGKNQPVESPNPGVTSEQPGDPFSRAADLLNPSPSSLISHAGVSRGGTVAGPITPTLPALPSAPGIPAVPALPSMPPAPSPGSILDNLNLPSPGGDVLARTFDQGIGDAARAQAMDDARRTVVIVKSDASTTLRRVNSQSRTLTRESRQMVGAVNAGTRTAVSRTNRSVKSSMSAVSNQPAGKIATQVTSSGSVRSVGPATVSQSAQTLPGSVRPSVQSIGSGVVSMGGGSNGLNAASAGQQLNTLGGATVRTPISSSLGHH